MKRKMLQLCAFFCCILLSISTVQAEQSTDIQPRYNYLINYSACITVDTTSSTALCTAKIIATGSLNINAECKLQKLSNNDWVTVASWTETGCGILEIEREHKVSSGYRYRFTYTAKITNGSTVLESVSKSDYATYN